MRIVSLLFVPLLLGMNTTGQPADSLSPKAKAIEEASIQQLLTAFISAWNIHDAKAFSMTFADDADFTNVRGMGAHGRHNIEVFHASKFNTWFKNSIQKITNSKIRFIRPNVAAVDAWWEMTGSTDAAGKAIPLRRGLLNFVMTKKAENWLILVMHNLEVPATP
jgi:uncharacterized protein (TIGR02246 family)